MAREMRGLAAQAFQQAQASGRVNIAGKVESLWQPLYDYAQYSAAQNAIVFFQNPIGQAGVGIANKTILDTNMELSGQIPKGQAFFITGIQVEMMPLYDIAGAALSEFSNDVYEFYRTGALILTIGSKAFATQAPLMKFSPTNRLVVDTSTGVATSSIQYATSVGREFTTEPLMLESNQNFNVQLLQLPLPSAEVRVGVTLNGYLYRNAQ